MVFRPQSCHHSNFHAETQRVVWFTPWESVGQDDMDDVEYDEDFEEADEEV